MSVLFISVISICLQFTAVFLALRLIPVTGRRRAWVMISFAIVFMALRRCITLGELLMTHPFPLLPPDPPVILNELVSLATSLFMLIGIGWIAPLFFSIKRAADQLRESEEKYRGLFEDSKDAVFVCTREGCFTDLNRSALDLFGRAREELVGSNIAELAADPAGWRSFTQAIERDGSVKNYEIKLRGKGGVEIACLLTSSVMRDSEGAAVGHRGIIHDITERKQMEEELRKKNAILDATLSAAPVGIGLLNGRSFDWANKTMCWMLGYAPSEMAGKSCASVYSDSLEYERVGNMVYRSGSRDDSCGVLVDSQWLRSDGSSFDCLIRGCPLDHSDPTKGWIVAALDITQRKRAEQALRESEARYRTLFMAAHDPVILVNEAGSALDCNPAVEKVLGLRREDVIGGDPFRFSPEKQTCGERSKDMSERLFRLCLEGAPQRFDWLFRGRDGEVVDAEVVLSRVMVSGEAQVLAMFRDMRKQKAAQRQLYEEMDRLAAVLDGIPVPTVMVDDCGAVILWNTACEEFTGLAKWKMMGKPLDLTPIFGGRDLPVLAKLLLEMPEEKILEAYGARGIQRLDSARLGGIECKGSITVNGKRKVTRTAASKIVDSSGKRIGVIQCAEDVTKEEELQRQLLHAQKMEAVGRLAGGIAHDFNNLLMVISGYSDLISMQLDPKGPLWKRMEEIRGAVERASALTRQLLAFSRKQVVQTSMLDLNVVITDIEKMLQRVIGEDIELTTGLAPGLGGVMADAGQVEQIVMNLVVNARDAMPEGGRIVIETHNVDIDEVYTSQHLEITPGAYVVLSVSDTGSGMEKETLSHIFEPFFTTKERGKGTGLGLATVYGIVKQCGGHVWVYSEPKLGSVFKIYFPRVEGDAGDREKINASAEEVMGAETILLVEDDGLVRTAIAESLQAHGYKVLEAANGDDAIRICEEFGDGIDLLMTDMIMPGINGRELADRITAAHCGIKVFFMSGYTDGGITVNDLSDPSVVFLQKPFRLAPLLRKVRDVLSA